MGKGGPLMGWLDSGGGDGYDLLTPDQQALIDTEDLPKPKEAGRNTHYAMIVGCVPPRATVIAYGPKDFCEGALIDWLSKTGPVDDDEQALVLRVED